MQYLSSVRRAVFIASAATSALILSGCGGGGNGSGSGGGSATNRAPQITSATSAALVENTANALLLAASDPEGDNLTFAISGGDDAAQFQISGSTLQFRQLPDFERPADSNRDNVYNLTVSVQDSRGASASANLAIAVSNSKEGIAVRRVATGLTDPAGASFLLSLPPAPATAGKIAVARTNGEIYQVDGTTGSRTLLVDIFAGRPRGRLLALTYNTRRNDFYSGLYVVAQEPDGRVFMQRYIRSPLPELEIAPSGSPQVAASIFNGPASGLPGGDLFMTLSDETGANAQNPASPFGKLIFLEEKDPYAGASIGSGGHTVRIIGDGIRRSGGAGAFNGEILLSDQGGSLEHELTSFLPNARPLDFGWPGREGTRGIGTNPPAAVNGPRVTYSFGNGPDQGTGIIYGGLYRGAIADLDNRFVFGDRSGTFWSVKFADLASGFLLGLPQLDRRTDDFAPDAGRIESPVSFVIDDLDRMFILDADGELFRVDAA